MADFPDTLAALRDGLHAGEFSARDVCEYFLARIERCDRHINAFITVDADGARIAADQADQRLAAGERAPMLGIPLAQKDIFCSTGLRTSCGSRMLDNFVAPYDATVVSKLKDAGSVMLGKTNMDEFAMGSSNENSFYGPVRNPWDHDRVPGGSSGGSAAAVAAGMAPLATATDTGGSIRQPASFCGVSGLKPTYGRVSRWGMVAFASSLDQGGLIAWTAQDLAIGLSAIAGFDDRDSTSLEAPVPDYEASLGQPVRHLRIGVLRSAFAHLPAGESEQMFSALRLLEQDGAELCDIELPYNELSVPAYYVIAPAEASANLARYDGVRYGYRCSEPADLEDLLLRSRTEGFGREVKRRIMMGTYVLSHGYYDAYYRKAQKVRRLIRDDFKRVLAGVDVIATPTTPGPAFKLGEKQGSPVDMYLQDIFTIAVNLAGLPALSIPAGESAGLPLGLQLIGDDLTEAALLNCAHHVQQRSDWHARRPETTP